MMLTGSFMLDQARAEHHRPGIRISLTETQVAGDHVGTDISDHEGTKSFPAGILTHGQIPNRSTVGRSLSVNLDRRGGHARREAGPDSILWQPVRGRGGTDQIECRRGDRRESRQASQANQAGPKSTTGAVTGRDADGALRI
jgi:hypothetical protein